MVTVIAIVIFMVALDLEILHHPRQPGQPVSGHPAIGQHMLDGGSIDSDGYLWLHAIPLVKLAPAYSGALYYRAPPCPGQALNLRHSYLPIYLPTPPGNDKWVDRSTESDGDFATGDGEIVI